MNNILLVTLCLLISMTLASCGGGGGGSAASTPPPPPGFSLSGTITALAGSSVDSDVHDPAIPSTSNNSFIESQNITNPVILGGYVNAITDTNDYFRITLAANETINLAIAASSGSDLDLYLYGAGQVLVDSSLGLGSVRSVSNNGSGAGTYYIRVFANTGGSNYTLSIGQQAASVNTDNLSIQHDFIPGDVIVRFKDQPATSVNISALETRLTSTGLTMKRGGLRREALLSLGNTDNRRTIFNNLAINLNNNGTALPATASLRQKHKWETIQVIKALRKRQDIEYAEPNYILHPVAAEPADPLYPLQWHYPFINLPSAWSMLGDPGIGVTVAVVDTGILLNHPDMSGRLVTGYDFISDSARARDGNGIDNNPDDPGDNAVVNSSFHGTHVAGTIAAAANNAVGVAGIAWNAMIMPVRVLGQDGGSLYDILQGIRYAAGLPNDSGTTVAPVDIINLSLAGGGFSQSAQDLFTTITNNGIIVIAAAGNESSSSPGYPASYAGVISVGAIDINKNRAPYSNFGATLDVVAPGGGLTTDINADGYPDGVLSTGGDDSSGSINFVYPFFQGTSMASPHIAGVVALMKSEHPGLTPASLDTLLTSGQITDDLGSTGRDDSFGYGLINAYKAVLAAQDLENGTSTAPDPLLVATPLSFNLGFNATSALLSLGNGGGGTLTVNAPTDDGAWLTVTESTVDGNKLGIYTLNVDRNGLADGNYTATISFTSNTNTVTVPVFIQVASITATTNAGRQYILLIDADTGNIVNQTFADASNGIYTYSFTGIDAGFYKIYSGSDMNHDFFICDPGESCGTYPTLNQPLTITVDSNLGGLDFTTGFDESVLVNATNVTDRVPFSLPLFFPESKQNNQLRQIGK